MKRLKDSLKYHLVDSTAILAESTPIFAAYETLLVGMSDDISLNARVIAGGLGYLGLATALSKGRDLWRKKFGIGNETKEKIQTIHDTLYLGAFNLVAGPLLYLAAGSSDLKEIAAATGLAILIGGANGAPLGYAIDLGRDLTGLRNCERPSYPESLKRMGSKTKMGLAALLTAGTIALTAGIYAATPNEVPQETQYSEVSNSIEVLTEDY